MGVWGDMGVGLGGSWSPGAGLLGRADDKSVIFYPKHHVFYQKSAHQIGL